MIKTCRIELCVMFDTGVEQMCILIGYEVTISLQQGHLCVYSQSIRSQVASFLT